MPSGPVSTPPNVPKGKCAVGNVFIQQILVAGGDYENAEDMIGELIPVLKEMAWPDVTTRPLFAGYCLRAQMAQLGEDWAEGVLFAGGHEVGEWERGVGEGGGG